MSESRETVYFDLSDDNADLFDTFSVQCSNREAQERWPLKDPLSQDSRESVIDALRSIQKENPQVETIFIDSDEDEDALVEKPNIILPDIQPLSSNVFLPRTNIAFPTSSSSSHDFHSSNYSQNSKFRVTEISPSMLTPNIVKNANTIALQDESKGSSSRKYLVIPKEVFPILATSKGPISLNVPGIGPLLIPKPSEMIKSPGITIDKNVQISVQDLKKKSVPVEKPVGTAVCNPLCDPKFQCWRYRKGIKRDLEGFSYYDRLGFYQAEQKKTKVCANKMNEIVEKLQCSINVTKRKLWTVRGIQQNIDNIEQVEIAKIKKERGKQSSQRRKKKSEKMVPPSLTAYQKKNLSTLISWKKHFESSEADELLVTKKVVILKGAKRGRKKKVEPKGFIENGNQDCDHNYSAPEPIGLKENEDTDNEEPGTSGQAKSADLVHSKKKNKGGRPRKHKPIDGNKPVKRKRGRPKKVQWKNRLTYYANLYNVKPCCVELSPVKVDPEMLEKYETYYKRNLTHCQVIDSLKQFQGEIDPAKPILVVNDVQCATMDMAELCCINNIIFPTSDISNVSQCILTSPEAHNVLFVKPEILCTYLSGVRA